MSARLEAAVAELVAAIVATLRAEAQGGAAPERLMSVVEAAVALGVGRSALYDAIGVGDLRSIKVGRRRLIPASSIEKFIQLAVNAPSVVLPSTTGTAGVPRPQRRPSVVPDSTPPVAYARTRSRGPAPGAGAGRRTAVSPRSSWPAPRTAPRTR
jgi:excisionase family DNA binding protein